LGEKIIFFWQQILKKKKGKIKMKILAIDPGTEQSAFVLFDAADFNILSHGKVLNLIIRVALTTPGVDILVIESIKSYGMPIGDSVIETCMWIGRFLEFWEYGSMNRKYELIPRKQVVTAICNNPRGNDSHVRQALLNRFREFHGITGAEKEVIGTKDKPGPLYGISGDVWQALALAIVAADRLNKKVKEGV
jgi:hypothetical protein